MRMIEASQTFEAFKIAGHLYTLDSYKTGDKLPAIIVAHPFGGVKEQTAGLYAEQLSKDGFVTLAFDRRYQGARVLGICAGGGYVIFAASSDRRVKAVATVSGVDIGAFIRTTPKPALDAILDDAGQARIEYAKTGQVKYLPIVPELNKISDTTPALMAEGADYYLTSRGAHPGSINRTAIWGCDKLVVYDSFAQVDQISPRPLLLIAGSKADTFFFSEKAFQLAAEPREFHIVNGSTHIDLYDCNAPLALLKLIEFFKQKL